MSDSGEQDMERRSLSPREAEDLFHRLSKGANRRRVIRSAGTVLTALMVLLVSAAAAWGVFSAFQPGQPLPPVQRGGAPAGPDQIVFSRGGPDGGIYSVNANGTGLTQLTSVSGDGEPTWSPDRSKIAFVRSEAGDANIYSMNADGTGVTQLTTFGSDQSPAFSPDGYEIAFSREADGNSGIYVMGSDGQNQVKVSASPLAEVSPAWSPDGERIAFIAYSMTSDGPSPTRIHIMNLDGTGNVEIGPADVAYPVWSPDGQTLLFVNTRTNSIYQINADGTDPHLVRDVSGLTDGLPLTIGLSVSPEGDRVAFAAGPLASATRIYMMNADGSGLGELTDGSTPDADPAWGS